MIETRPIYRPYRQVNPATGRTYASPTQAAALENLVNRWLETHSPGFMFDALEYCDDKDIVILPVLRKHMADAARSRRNNAPTKAMREGMKAEAFRIMANLIIHGATLYEAAGKVAVASGNQWKASTLERDYSKEYRKTEDHLRQYWIDDPDPDFAAEWVRIRQTLREPTDEERGERR